MENKAEEELIKITLLGDEGSGKSSLLHRLTNQTINQKIKPTIGIEIFQLSIQKKSVMVIDTAGREIVRPYLFNLKEEKIIGIVVDGSQKFNSNNFVKWLNLIKTESPSNTLIFILINKNDLSSVDNDLLESIQHIAKQEKVKILLISSCSAKTGNGITEAFEEVVKRIMDSYQGKEEIRQPQVIEENVNRNESIFSLFSLVDNLFNKISQHPLLAINLLLFVITLAFIILAACPPAGGFLALGLLFPGAGELVAAGIGLGVILIVNAGIMLAKFIANKYNTSISSIADNPISIANSIPDSENLLLDPSQNPLLSPQKKTPAETQETQTNLTDNLTNFCKWFF